MTAGTDLIALIGSLRNANVLCIGDVMLDRFVSGNVERISPEAPIPVLRIESETAMLGGAGNVVRNLAALGARVHVVGLIGKDGAGAEIRSLLRALKTVKATLLTEPARQSAIKTRYLAGAQQLMRADRETVAPIDVKTRKDVLKAANEALKNSAVLVLSDYGKGMLTDGIAKELIAAARKAKVPVIVDPKSTSYADYAGASVITPNRQELRRASGRAVDSDKAVIAAAKSLIKKHRLGAVLATRSRDGMTLIAANGKPVHLATEARDVFDVSGAGDTVVAALAAGLSVGAALEDAARIANAAAGIVVGKVGTATANAEEIVAALHHQTLSDAEAKVFALESLLDRIDLWRRRGWRVGFTNGCFDLLHPGHVSLLKQARNACDRLIVALNADTSVARLKGAGRPVQNEAARAAVLASLADVDAVTIFSEDTPLKLIEKIRPDVLIKGADYTRATVVGADVVERHGGKVFLAELVPGQSTSATIKKLNKKSKK
ncbi:MAG: D-glycero-beta-D-manno-heptose-7-phosphate kinase [Rhodospirillales bacterium]